MSENVDGQQQAALARDFSERLRGRAAERHISRSNLQSWTGSKKQTFAGYWNGERMPPADLLFRLSEELDVSPRWLLYGESDPPPAAAETTRGRSEAQSSEVAIDSIDLAYGLGGTFVDIEHGALEVEKAMFSRTWLRKFTHSPPEFLFTTSGVGDSMMPTINDHDIVIIDRSERLQGAMGDKIWAVVFGGVGMIKRLRPMPDGTVKIMSDNQAVRDEVATDSDLHIIGRVVAVVRRQ